MDLIKLFEMQKVLDSRILKEKGLEVEFLVHHKLLALLVELGELANETRCFKFWSNKPPSKKEIQLEEFVDGIHFFISLAIDFDIKPYDFIVYDDFTETREVDTFLFIFNEVSAMYALMDLNIPATITDQDLQETLHHAFSAYVGLGEKFLNFSWEQIEQAYISKNTINHNRQDNGY